MGRLVHVCAVCRARDASLRFRPRGSDSRPRLARGPQPRLLLRRLSRGGALAARDES